MNINKLDVDYLGRGRIMTVTETVTIESMRISAQYFDSLIFESLSPKILIQDQPFFDKAPSKKDKITIRRPVQWVS